MHKVCAGPYPSSIAVPSTSNNEPCYAFIRLLACLALISVHLCVLLCLLFYSFVVCIKDLDSDSKYQLW